MGKAFEKTIKNNYITSRKNLKDLKLEDQTKSIEEVFPKDHENVEIKNDLHKIKWYENKVFRDNLFYESSKQIYHFKIFKAIRSFVIVFRNWNTQS